VKLLSSFDDRKIVIFSGGRVAMPRTTFSQPWANALALGVRVSLVHRLGIYSARRGAIAGGQSLQLSIVS
jgi:hypothetical protein